MDDDLEGKSFLEQHIKDIESFLTVDDNLNKIKNEMKGLFKQKHSFGLINNIKTIDSFNNKKPELIIILANHDPDKSKLRNILKSLPQSSVVDIKFAVSNFMGLYPMGVQKIRVIIHTM